MSIFITTNDSALDRFTLDDGTEIAIGYDLDADSPFGIGDTWEGIAIRRAYGRDTEWDGDTSLGRRWEEWLDGYLLAEELPGREYEIQVTDLYGHPSFQVIISNEFWEIHGIEESAERALKEAETIAKEWGHWAEGEVYLIEVTGTSGEVEIIGNVYGDVTKDNVEDYL